MSNSGRNTTLESEAMRTTFSERVTKTFYFIKLKELIPVDFLFVNDVSRSLSIVTQDYFIFPKAKYKGKIIQSKLYNVAPKYTEIF